jgi:hypothetical protein
MQLKLCRKLHLDGQCRYTQFEAPDRYESAQLLLHGGDKHPTQRRAPAQIMVAVTAVGGRVSVGRNSSSVKCCVSQSCALQKCAQQEG